MRTESRKQKAENRKQTLANSEGGLGKKKPLKKEDNKKINYEELEGKYMRALADYQNLLKRTTEEKQEFAKYANEGCVREILPVYDNLRISLEHIDVEAKGNGWAEGIKYVVKQFAEILKNMGVEEIKAKGKKFDHNTMEAIEGEGEKVKEVVRPGYKLKDKVIIPAKVILKN
ncbi:nucleotide exchange factor GrpE [Candidatus Parcubacteria bacterium]|nr:nucleotide exchange factor GrpE [Candidatus Parcubacteria bacterium]